MTVTKPQTKTRYLNFFVILAALIIGGGMLYIFEYNKLASARYEIGKAKEDILKAELAGADLEHLLFEITDPKRLEEAALEHSLVLEEKPTYLRVGKEKEVVSVLVSN